MLRFFGLLFLIGLAGHPVTGQDSHYWSSNYGPGGLMTPGATLVDTRDSGVFFYNPALLAIRPQTALEFSGSLYQFETTRIANALGRGKDLNAVTAGISPQIHSGSFKLKNTTHLALAYALIHTHVLNDRVTQRQDARLNALNDAYSPGAEAYLGQYSELNQVSELAGVFGAGYRVSNHVFVGAMLEAPLRRRVYDLTYSGRVLHNPLNGEAPLFPPLSNTELAYRVTYTQLSLRPKLGLAYNRGRHHVGLLLTLPLLKVFGQGLLMSDQVITNLRLLPTASPVNQLANTRQTGLPTNYRGPLSLGLGYGLDVGRCQVYVAAEYFARLNEYNVLAPRNEVFIRPDTANNAATLALLRFKDARRAVLNVALGLSFPVKPAVTGYVSARTDFSYADAKAFANDEGFVAYATDWNILHGQLGVNIRREKYHFRSGLLLSYGGTRRYRSEVNFDTPNESNLLLGDPTEARVTHLGVGLLLSFIHNL